MNNKFINNNIDLVNKNIVLRVDYNVSIKNNKILNSYRIKNSMLTIDFLFKKNINNLVLISHLGRPNGKYNLELSLKPIYNFLKEYFPNIIFSNLDNCINLIKYSKNKVILLENIRFYPEEERNSDDYNIDIFEKKISDLGDVFVNDAFGTCHRNHCSVIGKYFKCRYLGLLIKKELDKLSLITNNVKKPFTCILGGSKVSDKIKMIYNLLDKVYNILIGGGMCFTFLKIRDNMNIGNSLYDKESEDEVKKILMEANKKKVNIYLPIDFIITDKISDNSNSYYVSKNKGIKDKFIGVDIGMKTSILFEKILENSNTILWNGPLGIFEIDNFSLGSKMISNSLEKIAERNIINKNIIIAGGDTVSCFDKFIAITPFVFKSTGGGSTLKFLEGTRLPGIF